MIGNWRSPLDKNLVVGIVFDDVRKAVDSISHHVLLNKLQAFGFAGDLLCWIEDYLDDRSRASVGFGRCSVRNFTCEVWRATGICFGTYPVFVDLPDIVEDCDGEIHIYADNIKIYVTASSPDMVVFALNVILQKLYDWCCLNRLIPPPPPVEPST